jgi:hypothetical protein
MHFAEIRRRHAAAQARTAILITDRPATRRVVAVPTNAAWQRVAITESPPDVLGGP